MSLDDGEKQFYRIVLLNKFVSQEILDLIVKQLEGTNTSLPAELRARNKIRPDIIDKIVLGIQNHGENFTKPLIKVIAKEEFKIVDEHLEHVPGLSAPTEPISFNKIEPRKSVTIEFALDVKDQERNIPEESKEKLKSTPIKVEPAKNAPAELMERNKIEGPGLIPNPISKPKGLGLKLIEYLQYARNEGASDFHLSPTTLPFIRKHGQIIKIGEKIISAEESMEMLFSILSERQLEKIKSNLGLDYCLISPDNLRYRANIIQGSNGWSGTFRIINEQSPSFDSLGLPNVAKRLTEYHQGLVLVTGSKGCGKTTTLAAMIDLINSTRREHIITVEDPIEYVHSSKLSQVTQRALGINTMSYANALRGALREDPDIIMVGELRDLDTISASISAAETGHLVLASLHTTSAIRTVDRIIDAFPAKQQGQIRVMIAESIRGVICQQLLPRADGNGTVLAVEVLLNNVSVRKNIIEGKTFMLDNIMQTSVRDGMIRMDDSIYQLWQQGVITEAIAREYAREPSKLGKSMSDVK